MRGEGNPPRMPVFVPRTLLDRVLSRFFRRRAGHGWVLGAAVAACLAAPLTGCATAASSRAKLDDAVQETNVAARFGRGDVAVERVHASARDAFLRHHRRWGSEVRIVDVELGGIERMTSDEAVVLVTFAWFRPAEGRLRTSVLRQTWKPVGESGWWLFAEDQASGDVGLLEEPPKTDGAPAAKEPPRSRYETTTIVGD